MPVPPFHNRRVTITYDWRGDFENADVAALHADFEDHLARFYFQACGFAPTRAGLIRLPDDRPPAPGPAGG